MGLNEYTITLDSPFESRPRYPLQVRPHPRLHELLASQLASYRDLLISFLAYGGQLAKIPAHGDRSGSTPYWMNGFIPGLDGVSLYSTVAANRPRQFFEIGSGNSTKFVHQAIRDHGLSTRIVSIDPSPTVTVDQLCDQSIRRRLEDCDLALFDELDAGDVLFVDDSHRCFMNSDVTVFFLDILPRLRPGVVVGIHDICLPYDYPADWADRYYSEQYLLACWLLAGTSKFKVLLPSVFASTTPSLAGELEPLWTALPAGVERHGSIFWLRIEQ